MKMEDIIKLRKAKKGLYIELLRKGLRDLTDAEKATLNYLSIDADIILMLSNGQVFCDTDERA